VERVTGNSGVNLTERYNGERAVADDAGGWGILFLPKFCYLRKRLDKPESRFILTRMSARNRRSRRSHKQHRKKHASGKHGNVKSRSKNSNVTPAVGYTPETISEHPEIRDSKPNPLSDYNFWFGIITVLGLIVALLALWLYFADKEAGKSSGFVMAQGTATTNLLIVGPVQLELKSTNGVFLVDQGRPLVALELRDGKLLVSAVIRDPHGDLIAELVRNNWKLNNNLLFDRNFNDHAVEVRGRNGDIVLQVVDLGPYIHFSGILRCSSGRPIAIGEEQGGATFDQKDPPRLRIIPVFEYPSDTHLGAAPGIERVRRLAEESGKANYVFSNAVDFCSGDGPGQSFHFMSKPVATKP
jgi:hypothetical protein